MLYKESKENRSAGFKLNFTNKPGDKIRWKDKSQSTIVCLRSLGKESEGPEQVREVTFSDKS